RSHSTHVTSVTLGARVAGKRKRRNGNLGSPTPPPMVDNRPSSRRVSEKASQLWTDTLTPLNVLFAFSSVNRRGGATRRRNLGAYKKMRLTVDEIGWCANPASRRALQLG